MSHDPFQDQDPSKRIPKSLNTDAKLLGRYTLADAVVALFPGVVVVLATQVLIPSSVQVGGRGIQTLTLPLAGTAIAIGAVFVTLTPNYTDSVTWVGNLLRFYRSDRQLDHEDAAAYTQVEQVHPEHDAIERTDGALVAILQVDPPNMALATDAEWRQRVESFQEFLNTTVEFPIQIHSTTREFEAETHLSHYESRLSDPDVQENPQLQALIEHYVDWYREDLDRRQMTIRDHYIIVPITPGEVQHDDESLAGRLIDLPVVGVFVQAWLAPPRAVQLTEMSDKLDARCRSVQTGLRDIEGCHARRLPAADATEVVASFWAGEQVEYGTVTEAITQRPILRRQTDE